MSNISLRSYNREIESMIDQGRIDEAIAHARHVLKSFPKVIETYRLLGKAYLENSQNNDAADIFQRVLSAVPDDFVAHIGMSLIREEEGNLSSAVQHMERAFEKQPYNNAIQEELKRLYGKRDGIEPPKVRLTQGALARMYLKGDLQQQGIAELRAALTENPDRYDLKTLLAEAYAEADQMAEAIDLSSDLLKKFPYNLTANRILANTLKTHDHPQEMAVCRQRLYALAPYEAYISEHAPTVDQVPDRAIAIDRLDWSEDLQSFPTRTREETTPWTSSTEDSPQEKENLDWLDPAGDDIEEKDPVPEETLDSRDEDEETSPPAKENIPGWMEEAGWTETDHIDEELQKGYQDLGQVPEEPGQATGDLAPADIPDWLLEKAPSSESEDAPGEASSLDSTEASIPEPAQDDLSEIPDEPLDQKSLEDSDIQEEEIQLDKEPAEESLTAKPQEEEIQPTDDDLPGWLKDLKSEEDDQETAIAWLKDMPQDFLSTAEDSTAPSDSASSDTIEDESAQPDWFDEMMAEDEVKDDHPAVDQAPVSTEDDPFSKDEFPEKPSPPEPLSEGKAETSASEFPDWFEELQAESTEEEKPVQETTSEEDESGLSDQDLDWSPGFDIEDIDQDPAAPEEDADQGEDIWQDKTFSDLDSGTPEDQDQEDQIPDWLSDLDSEEDFEDEPDMPGIPAPDATLDSEETPRGEDDLLFDESGPTADDDDDDETELDQLFRKQSEFTAQDIEEESRETTADSEPASDSARSEGSLPDWLTDLDLRSEEVDVEPSDDGEFTPPPSPEKLELQNAQTEEVEEEDEISAEEEEIPDWLGDQAQQTQEPEAAPDLDDEEDSMAWLEGLAAKQGAKEEDFVTSAEERAEAQPPPVEEDITDSPEKPQPAEPEEPPTDAEAVKGELPDWLAELQSDQIPEDVEEEEAPTAADDESFSPDEPDLETKEDIFTEQSIDKSEEPETREESAQETSLPDWLTNLDVDETDLETEEKPPFGEDEFSPTEDTIVDEPSYPDPEMEDSLEEPQGDTAEQREPDKTEGGTPPEATVDSPDGFQEYDFLSEDDYEEEVSEGEGSLPDWLAELEAADSEDDSRLEEEEYVPESSPHPDDDQSLPDFPTAETEPAPEEEIIDESDQSLLGEDGKGEAEPIEESTISPIEQEEVLESEPDSSDFGGMLDHLKSDDTAEEIEEVPDWIKNLKEEEDPQETAILWLQNFIEKGDQADLKSEIEHYTDNLHPDQDLPNWMEDLQKEEDPQTTAMLWLEKLEKEQIWSESEKDDLEESDWLADLEQEQKTQEAESKSAADIETDDRDWLGELEEDDEKQEGKQSKQWAEATGPISPEDQETEGDTPDWMKATSPLEGDFLTSELESELDQEEIQEEIPNWLAGYEDEDEILPEDEEAEEDLGVQADQESERKELPPDDDYTWLAEGEEQEPETIEPSPAKTKFNLNRAGISDLESIFGVSFQAAKSIVSYREKHGNFQSFAELNDIPEVEPDQIKTLRENTHIPAQDSKDEAEKPEPKDEPAPAFDDKHQKILYQAQQALEFENIDQALENYSVLIDKKKHVDQVIDDLTSASLEYPMNIQIIKTLGDAYMKIDQLQEALDAYSKAEDLLR